MRIVLSSDGSVELLRGERITRGQDLSRRIYVEWNENESPIDTGQFLADNMVVEMCITRPDGEQSGWLTAVKVDGEIKYLYILQAWDTAVSGQASVQVRWYDITQEEGNRIIEVSNEAFFIVDNGKIAQPLNLSSENYNEIVLQFITPLSNQAFRKYDVNKLPNTIIFSDDGLKTAPALYYNFSHDVIDIVSSSTNDYALHKEEKKTRVGTLIVDQLKDGNIQNEVFINEGGIYYRKITDGVAEEFKGILQTAKVDLTEYQKKTDNALETESKEIVGAINEINDGKVDKDSNEFIRKGEAVNKSDATFGLYGRLNGHEKFFVPNKYGTRDTEGTIPVRSVTGTLRAETANNSGYDYATGDYTTMHDNTLTNVKFVRDNYLNKKIAQTMSGRFYDWQSCLQLKSGASGENVNSSYDKDAAVILNVRDNIGRSGAHINIFNSETSFYKKKVNIGNGSSLIISDRKINADKTETETTIYNKLSKNGNEFNVDTVFNSNASINNAPIEETHITNKKYVDDKFAPKLFTHNITLKQYEVNFDYARSFVILEILLKNKQSTPYTSIEELVGLTLDKVVCYVSGDWDDELMDYTKEYFGTYENVTIEIENCEPDLNYPNPRQILRLKNSTLETVLFLDTGMFFQTFEPLTDIVE